MRNELGSRGARRDCVEMLDRDQGVLEVDPEDGPEIVYRVRSEPPGGYVRLDRVLPGDMPLEKAESLAHRHQIPARVFSGLVLVNPGALNRAWSRMKRTGGVYA